MSEYRLSQIKNTKKSVIKIGSALLTNDGAGLDREILNNWVAQIAQQAKNGQQIVLVSSGAIAEGMQRLSLNQRPERLFELQAVAAVGQMGLVQAWESAFSHYGIHTAQILLTHEDLSNRTRYLNARSTILQLLDLGIIPIVNENDTVVTDEIRFGDNDTLGALVSNLVEADLLLILTDQQGMYESDPRANPQAQLLEEVTVNDERLDSMAGNSKGKLGRGGMATKLSAARLAARSGCATVIASGKVNDIINNVFAGLTIGTLLKPDRLPLVARKQWLAAHMRAKGSITLDNGAINKLKQGGCSLLAIGIVAVSGDFSRGDLVLCVNSSGHEIARGLCNYHIDEVKKIMRQPSKNIQKILGYCDEPEVIHRDNLVLS